MSHVPSTTERCRDQTHLPSSLRLPNQSCKAKMSLPTRDSFMSTGLVPVTSEEPCPICLTEPMASPVKTPCNHVFCRECITQWLNQPSKASCAMCRKQLFQREHQDLVDEVQIFLAYIENLARNSEPVPEYHPVGEEITVFMVGGRR